jgi:hypothetical protein
LCLWGKAHDRDLFQLQKSDIVKLQDGAFSSVPNHKPLPLSVWRQCEILWAINRVASLAFRHDPERNKWRIVFKPVKDIERVTAREERRRRSAGAHNVGFELYSPSDL